MKSLEDTACLGKKHFERVFSSFTGYNPKQFVKIVRFQSALLNYQLKPNLSMSDLAFLCGYYDVSHFVNDFKSFTNRTPKLFFQTIPIESEYFTF